MNRALAVRLKKLKLAQRLVDAAFIAAGVISASIGLKGFLLPNNFLDGGATGASLLIEILTKVDLSLIIVVINLPFILIGARQISVPFAIKSSLAILSLAALVHFLSFPAITADKLLIAVFGGFFLGAGIGCAIRGGAVIDGTEVLAIAISRKTSLTVGDFIALFNLVLFSFSAFFISIETAMYSMLTYLSASKTVDFIINGIEEYVGVTIISARSERIRVMIVNKLGRGVTVYKAEGGYGKTGAVEGQSNILFCVVTRLEVTQLLTEVTKLDERAFVVQHTIKDTKGGMIKKRPLH